jgi:DNA polymerase-1
MIVTRDNFDAVLREICDQERISVDTETDGLYPFHGDRLFAVVVTTKERGFYFDFNINGELPRSWIIRLQLIFDSVPYVKFINYKFDMSMLAVEGITFPKKKMRILDGGVMARVHNNLHAPIKGSDEGTFSMDYLAQYYLNEKKSDEVKAYCKEHNLYKVDRMGDKSPDFKRVPREIMVRYALKDGRLTYDICNEILKHLNALDSALDYERPIGTPRLMAVMAREAKLCHVLFKMHFKGFKVDRDYVKRAIEHENKQIEIFNHEIKTYTSTDISTPAKLGEFLVSQGINLPMSPKTKKYLTNKEVLEKALSGSNVPIVKTIQELKKAEKRISTYYENYLKLADPNGIIHASINQEGTKTGRFSYSDPNLQNLTKDKVYHEWAVRNSFQAFEDYYLLCVDYAQQEMRVMADRAQEMRVVDKILSGMDFYNATGEVMLEIMNILFSRDTSKAISLGVAYGQGKDLIAAKLKCTPDEAKRFKSQYLGGMPGIQRMDKLLKERASQYGRIFNVYGRVLHIDKGFEYKALNAYVQGSSADMTKESLILVDDFFDEIGAKSLITCTVHDENIFNLHKDERELIPEIQRLMSEAYPHTVLPMAAEADISKTSWAAKVELEQFNFGEVV